MDGTAAAAFIERGTVMLVLSRRPGESVVIDADGVQIKIMFLDGSRRRIRVGVEAPEFCTIRRCELPDDKLHGDVVYRERRACADV